MVAEPSFDLFNSVSSYCRAEPFMWRLLDQRMGERGKPDSLALFAVDGGENRDAMEESKGGKCGVRHPPGQWTVSC